MEKKKKKRKKKVNVYLGIFCIVERAALKLEVSPSPALEGRGLLHQESLPRADLHRRRGGGQGERHK